MEISLCVLCVLTLLGTVYAVSEPLTSCPSGFRLEQGVKGDSDECVPCIPGKTFREESGHRFKSCLYCTVNEFDTHTTKVVAECTTVRDTRLRCREPGYHYDKDYNDCFPCSVCEKNGTFEAIPCSDNADALCCPADGMVVENGQCIEPATCGVRQLLVATASKESSTERCEWCPANTTNYEEHHTWTECKESCFSVLGGKRGNVKEKTAGVVGMERDAMKDSNEKNGEKFVERPDVCRHGEYKVGKSCTRKDMVVCDTYPQDESTGKGIYNNPSDMNTERMKHKPAPKPHKVSFINVLELMFWAFVGLVACAAAFMIQSRMRLSV